MTSIKTLVAGALLTVSAAATYAQAPVTPLASHNAVERHYVKHRHHHHHHVMHAPVRR